MGKMADEQPVSTEHDSVQRLAEIRLELSKYGELPSEEVDYLLSLIDSLTAERDRMKDDLLRLEWWEATCGYWHEQANSARASAEALNDLWDKTIDRIDAIARRAEAAEADRERLRGALGLIAGGESLDAHGCARVARAALSTPPSEGGTR